MYFVAPQNTSSALFTSWIKSTGYSSVYTTCLTNVNAIYYSSTYVYVKAEGIPSYTIGPWANPNTPSGQSWIYQFPISPSAASSQKDLTTYLGQVGAWSNGMPVYNAYDGFTWSSQGVWHRNAYWWENSSFDGCLGHPDDMGIYHNHVVPICLYTLNVSSTHSPIVGWSFDGYPIYGPYGYNGTYGSTITRITSSYQLSKFNANGAARTKLSNGTELSPTYYGPNVNTTYPAGIFLEDWVYTSGSGMLDECNGKLSYTPEYPNGTYAYWTTVDANFIPYYPFVIGPCYYGNQVLPNGKSVSIPSGVTAYYKYNHVATFKPQGLFYCLSLFTAFLFIRAL